MSSSSSESPESDYRSTTTNNSNDSQSNEDSDPKGNSTSPPSLHPSDSSTLAAHDVDINNIAPLIHIRIRDQFDGLPSSSSGEQPLQNVKAYVEELIHRLCPYPGKSYHHLQALIDWDHHKPSLNLIVRILVCYDSISKQTLIKSIEDTEKLIREENLFPEFDVPNYSALVSDEVYTAVLDAKGENELEIQFTSEWRHQIDQKLGRKVVSAISQLDVYTNAMARRKRGDLGDPIIVGWMAPAIAHSLHWAVEVWLVTEFVGYRGKALVFFVDSETLSVTRFYETEIQAS